MNIHSVPPEKRGLFVWLLSALTGVEDSIMRRCPGDANKIRLVGGIQIANFIYVSAMLAIMGHKLFAPDGRFRPEFVLGGIFLGGMLTLIDAALFVYPAFVQKGLSQIRDWGGYPIAGSFAARLHSALTLFVRMVLSIGLAGLIGISASLVVVAEDVNAILLRDWREANRQVIATATALVDDMIKKAEAAVTEQNDRVATLTGQVNDLRAAEIDPSAGDARIREAQKELTDAITRQGKADDDLRDSENLASRELGGIKVQGTSGLPGDGPLHHAAMEEVGNAKARARDAAAAVEAMRRRVDALRQQGSASDDTARQRAHDQLPEFESALATETATLAKLNTQSETLSRTREDEIRHKEESSPDYVPLNQGFLAQVGALERITESDPAKRLLVIFLEMASFGFEFSVVLVAMNLMPTKYSLYAASDLHDETIYVTDHMVSVSQKGADAGLGEDVLANLTSVNDNHGDSAPAAGEAPIFGASATASDQPIKRKRGRPRKYPPPM